MSQPIWTRWEPTCKLIFVKSLWEHKLLLKLLAVTLIMLIKLGKLNPPLDLLTLQSKILPQPTLQELILVCSCAKILHSTELLVWVGTMCKGWAGYNAGVNEKRQNVLATSEVVAHE